MAIAFAWSKHEENFDPIRHGRCDLDILKLAIDHREGEVALATIVVPNSNLPFWDRRHAYISYGDTLLFSGRLVGLPVKINNDLVSLELSAEPLDADLQLQSLANDL